MQWGRIVLSLITVLVIAPFVALLAAADEWLISGVFAYFTATAIWKVLTGRAPKVEVPDLSPQAIRRGLEEFPRRLVEDLVRTFLMIGVVAAWVIGVFGALAGLGLLLAFLAADSGLDYVVGWILVLPAMALLVVGPIFTWRWLGRRGIGGVARRDGRG